MSAYPRREPQHEAEGQGVTPQPLPPRPTPLWLLVLVTLSGTLAMHMFVPALPDVTHALGASSAQAQATISVYIFGLALGQLVYGPLSDALGRRPLLLAGLFLYTLGGVAALLAPDLRTLLIARLLQALGGCAGLALGRAMVHDTHAPQEAVRALALLMLMMMVGPGLAPLVGSGLVLLGGWRMVCALLALMGALTLWFAWRRVTETAVPSGRVSVRRLWGDYAALLRSPRFVGYAVGGSCATTANYAFIAAAPFIITEQLQRPLADVGYTLAFVMLGVGLGNLLTRRLAAVVRLERLLLWGNGLSAASALLFFLYELLGYLALSVTVALMWLFLFGAGIASPAAMAKVLAVDARRVGSAAGLYGFLQMALGAALTWMVGWGSNPALAAATVLLIAAVLAQSCLRWAIRAERRERRARFAT